MIQITAKMAKPNTEDREDGAQAALLGGFIGQVGRDGPLLHIDVLAAGFLPRGLSRAFMDAARALSARSRRRASCS